MGPRTRPARWTGWTAWCSRAARTWIRRGTRRNLIPRPTRRAGSATCSSWRCSPPRGGGAADPGDLPRDPGGERGARRDAVAGPASERPGEVDHYPEAARASAPTSCDWSQGAHRERAGRDRDPGELIPPPGHPGPGAEAGGDRMDSRRIDRGGGKRRVSRGCSRCNGIRRRCTPRSGPDRGLFRALVEQAGSPAALSGFRDPVGRGRPSWRKGRTPDR